jgi:hypothetical protein
VARDRKEQRRVLLDTKAHNWLQSWGGGGGGEEFHAAES